MKKLTKAEEEIMIKIWEKKACTVSEIISEIAEPKPAHSTVSSFIRILEKKGFVNHKAYGRTYEYFPIVAKSDYFKKKINFLASDFFGGSINDMVSFIVKENNMTLKEMTELIDRIDNAED